MIAIATSSTTSRITGIAVRPSEIRIRKVIRAMKPPIMKTSPWAKLIMPTMP
ncbi:hypothetical protein ACVIHC_002428 [Bradyrhizobium diazoefficiens]